MVSYTTIRLSSLSHSSLMLRLLLVLFHPLGHVSSMSMAHTLPPAHHKYTSHNLLLFLSQPRLQEVVFWEVAYVVTYGPTLPWPCRVRMLPRVVVWALDMHLALTELILLLVNLLLDMLCCLCRGIPRVEVGKAADIMQVFQVRTCWRVQAAVVRGIVWDLAHQTKLLSLWSHWEARSVELQQYPTDGTNLA
jgi:hypothetical protein